MLKLCEGFKARADALYASGEFEKALLDYCSCCDRRRTPEYQLGVDNCRESIRKAFNYSIDQVNKALECLEKGVLLERETKKPSSSPQVTLKRANEYGEDLKQISDFHVE